MLKFKANSRKENHNEINISNSKDVDIDLVKMLNEINSSLGYIKSSIELVSKQIDKLAIVDEDIKEKQKMLEIDVRQLQLNQERILKKLGM